MIVSTKGWSYGVEHEFADYDRRVKLPKGCVNNKRDWTCVNSNGIANDPSDRIWYYGGEVNTPPTDSPDGQVEILEALIKMLPDIKVNYRSNLHVHIRVPGLRDDLEKLKQVQLYIHTHMPILLNKIEPIPVPTFWDFNKHVAKGYKTSEFDGAIKRYKRRLVSHHTLLTSQRLQRQMAARTVKQFFEAEVPHRKDGSPCWHLQPRCCVSLRQLNETDTVEFRHFAGSLNSHELWSCVDYCRNFLVQALENAQPDVYNIYKFPVFPRYQHDLEVKYRATVHDGTIAKDAIVKNIKLIETGQFREI